MVQMQFVPFWDPTTFHWNILWVWKCHIWNLEQETAQNNDFHCFRGFSFKDTAPFRGSFISRLTFCTDPPIFRIAATRKRNGVEISNSQNFLVSMISTSILNKKKIHDIGCTPLFELGWNDPISIKTRLHPITSIETIQNLNHNTWLIGTFMVPSTGVLWG